MQFKVCVWEYLLPWISHILPGLFAHETTKIFGGPGGTLVCRMNNYQGKGELRRMANILLLSIVVKNYGAHFEWKHRG